MKILQLRFKNLNSLYGEWKIDFTTAEYLADGIFAITGPTGAGKSTILDAICLALYGRTPRLDKVNKGSNEIMSRQTGECYAEVVFAAQGGQFLCNWSQHRARKKADGNLADAKHEISDAKSGQILESKKRAVAKVIEEKTGMSFDRFTRSILLAQGGFDTFLKADSDKRAPVLEQITGTEIYSEISIRVHQRYKDEHCKLDLLLVALEGISPLSAEDETELLKELGVKQKIEKSLLLQQQETQKAIEWLKGIADLQYELATLGEEDKLLSKTIGDFEEKRAQLHLSQQAVELAGDYAGLRALREQNVADTKLLKEDNEQLPQTEIVLKRCEELLKEAESNVSNVKNEQKADLVISKQVRSLDLQIAEKKKAIDGAEQDYKKSELMLVKYQAEKKALNIKYGMALREQKNAQGYLVGHENDGLLVSQFTGIVEQVNNVIRASEDISVKNKLIVKRQKDLEGAIFVLNSKEGVFGDRKEKRKLGENKLVEYQRLLDAHLDGRLLREYRTDYEHLMQEIVLLREISNLKEQREGLEDGKACPLCGSKDHPFAKGNVPQLSEAELRKNNLLSFIAKAEEFGTNIKLTSDNLKELVVAELEAEKQLTKARHNKENIDKDVIRLQDEVRAVAVIMADQQEKVLSLVGPFGVQELPGDLVSLLTILTERKDLWQTNNQRQVDMQEKVVIFSVEEKGLDGNIGDVTQLLADKQVEVDRLQKDKKLADLNRQELYGDKEPDEEEIRLNKEIENAEDSVKLTRESYDLAGKDVLAIKTRISSLSKGLETLEIRLKIGENDFILACQKLGFADEKAFIASRLSAVQREELSLKAKELDGKHADLVSRQKDRRSRLEKEQDLKITEESLGKLQDDLTQQVVRLKEVSRGVVELKLKIKNNNEAKLKIKGKEEQIEAQKRECARLDKLHTLIGSADGKKYRNFAQGLTFELMVSHANIQLEKMTDRYLLIRDAKYPLELNVIDNYQAGEVRSTKNLSGGESFIVSLSLALGLSKMASRKVRVDSLFLDEGFGTLDEEALDTALETLGGLQQDGKLIGVISHVSALKERIGTQINVFPVAGGESVIKGPGCFGQV